MNLFIKSTLICIIPFLFSGCITRYVEKTSETMSQTAYAIRDSAQVGRYDLLDGYSENLLKLVPPPKQKIIIKDFNNDDFKTQYLNP